MYFRRLAELQDEEIDLLRAALHLARIQYPGLEVERYREMVDRWAAELHQRGEQTSSGLSHYLFEELGFRGNQQFYHDPRNSFLNDVLERRLGIPITLSLVYVELGQRLGLQIEGVGLPGHFIVRDRARNVLIDPFCQGKELSLSDCQARVQAIYGSSAQLEPEMIAAASARSILRRMMNNLRQIWQEQDDYKHLLQLLQLYLALFPDSPGELKQRAWLYARCHDLSAALADLERYCFLYPEQPDAADVLLELQRLQETLTGVN